MKVNYSAIMAILLFSCNNSGKEIARYPNGNMHYKVPVVSGQRNGLLEQYYEDGELQLTSEWKNGKKHGPVRSYYQNGIVKSVESAVNGLAHGEFLYYDSLGNLSEIVTVREGKENGAYYKLFPDSTLNVKAFFENGKREGKAEIYYKSGKLSRRHHYDNGNLVYLKAYSEEGVLYDCKLPIVVTEGDDGYKIELSYSEFENARIGIIIGNLNATKHLIDTLDVLGSKNLSYLYKPKEGIEKIEGILFEIKMPEDQITGQYYFEYVN